MKKTDKKTKVVTLAGLVLAGALFTAGVASAAGTTSGSMDVTAEVTGACDVVATGPVFSSVGGGSSFTFADGTIEVTCSETLAYTVALNEGLNFNGSYRALTSPTVASVPQYHLFLDAAYGTLWGDGVLIGSVLSDGSTVGAGVANTHTVFGAADLTTAATASDYSDIVVVTVAF